MAHRLRIDCRELVDANITVVCDTWPVRRRPSLRQYQLVLYQVLNKLVQVQVPVVQVPASTSTST